MEQEFEPAAMPRPPQGRISIDAEASLMNRGKVRNFSYLIAGALVVIGIGVLLVLRLGRADAYADAAASTATLGRAHFDGYFDCALPGMQASELNASRVQSGFARLGDRDGKGHGQALTKCLPQLRALNEGVKTLSTPPQVKGQRAGLVAAAGELAAANTHYLYYLTDGIAPYDATKATPFQSRLAAAWAGYRGAEGDLLRAIDGRP